MHMKCPLCGEVHNQFADCSDEALKREAKAAKAVEAASGSNLIGVRVSDETLGMIDKARGGTTRPAWIRAAIEKALES